MAKDRLSISRKKSRFVVEIRYKPKAKLFDRRGKILNTYLREFRSNLKEWRLEQASITLFDEPNDPSRQIHVAYNRSNIVYEDPETLQEFLNDTVKYLKIFYDLFQDDNTPIKRFGVRFITIHEREDVDTFEKALDIIKCNFLATNWPIPLDTTDCRLVINHENGAYAVGPAKKGESWIKSVFSRPDYNVPEVGFGIDVDSFSNDLEFSNKKELVTLFNKIKDVTVAVEYELAKAIGIINE